MEQSNVRFQPTNSSGSSEEDKKNYNIRKVKSLDVLPRSPSTQRKGFHRSKTFSPSSYVGEYVPISDPFLPKRKSNFNNSQNRQERPNLQTEILQPIPEDEAVLIPCRTIR